MDKNRFDGFTRQLAKRENRRQAIKTLFAGGVGTAATVIAGGETSAARTDCCPADHPTLCNLTCTDTIYDEQNCGDCGITCAVDQRCYKGVCESTSVVHCTAVSDCPGSDTECQKRTCKKGVCGTAYSASGKKVSTQTDGDCQRDVCDGAGTIISIIDNTDKPDAQGECWSGVCVNGAPQQIARPSGRTCSSGKCDGAGHCSGGGCATIVDCPGVDTDCATRTCTNGICGMSYTAADTETAHQTVGDCQKDICDGNGNIVSTIDDTDLPASQACATGSCNGGVAQIEHTPAGAPCQGGLCDGNGACVQCLVASDCLGTGTECLTITCDSGICGIAYVASGTPVSTQTDGDCHLNVCDGAGGITTIIDDTDAPSLYYDRQCFDSVCAGGTPTQPPKNAGAPCDGGVCDGAGGCVGCVADTDCQTPVANATTMCFSGNCSYTCNAGYGDCEPGPDGCETNLMTDAQNCGSCGHTCQLLHTGMACSSGQCVIVSCDTGFGDCDGDPENGCEVNTRTDPQNCGTCGNVCSSGVCQNGVCA